MPMPAADLPAMILNNFGAQLARLPSANAKLAQATGT
jgi:hypothetical protein